MTADTSNYLSNKETYEVIRERIVMTEDVAVYIWKEYQSKYERYEKWSADAAVFINKVVCFLYWKLQYFGFESIVAVKLIRQLARVYQNQGNYEKALNYSEKALAFSKRILGACHPETALTYRTMAGVYKDLGD